jgi:uncharacterized RDD family membrane protein YckC
MQDQAQTDTSRQRARRHARLWRWLLVLPYLGLCFPSLYARATPALLGFPFFYWYQFAWVLLASALIWMAYRKHQD